MLMGDADQLEVCMRAVNMTLTSIKAELVSLVAFHKNEAFLDVLTKKKIKSLTIPSFSK